MFKFFCFFFLSFFTVTNSTKEDMDWGLKRGKVDPSHGAYVKLRGTPYDTTKAEIKEFFEGKYCNDDDDEKKLGQQMRFWYLSHWPAAKVQILRLTHVFAFTKYGCR